MVFLAIINKCKIWDFGAEGNIVLGFFMNCTKLVKLIAVMIFGVV